MDWNTLISDIIDKQKFEYVLIVKFDNDYQLEKIIQLDWELFLKYKRWHKNNDRLEYINYQSID